SCPLETIRCGGRALSSSTRRIFADAVVMPTSWWGTTPPHPVGRAQHRASESMLRVAESRNQQPRNQQQSPPRQPRTMHGMITAVLVLVLLVGGMTGLIGRCSFNPGG